MNFDKEILKGSVDIIVLSLLSKRKMYGYEIAKKIRETSGNVYKMSEGTLYPALKRLEGKGYLQSFWQDTEQGKRRKYYQLTEEGKKVLAKKLDRWEKANLMIKNVIQGFQS